MMPAGPRSYDSGTYRRIAEQEKVAGRVRACLRVVSRSRCTQRDGSGQRIGAMDELAVYLLQHVYARESVRGWDVP